jgi:hypothetical protein
MIRIDANGNDESLNSNSTCHTRTKATNSCSITKWRKRCENYRRIRRMQMKPDFAEGNNVCKESNEEASGCRLISMILSPTHGTKLAPRPCVRRARAGNVRVRHSLFTWRCCRSSIHSDRGCSTSKDGGSVMIRGRSWFDG